MKSICYYGCLFVLQLFLVISGCSKVEEIPVEIQPPLQNHPLQLSSIQKILTESENVEIYKEIYKKSGIKAYMDSVHSTGLGENSPFTLIVPNDQAWIAGGYDLEKAKLLGSKECESL